MVLVIGVAALSRPVATPSAVQFLGLVEPGSSFAYERSGMSYMESSFRISRKQEATLDRLIEADLSSGQLSERTVLPEVITPKGQSPVRRRETYRGAGVEDHYMITFVDGRNPVADGKSVWVTVVHRVPSPLLTRLGNLIRGKPW